MRGGHERHFAALDRLAGGTPWWRTRTALCVYGLGVAATFLLFGSGGGRGGGGGASKPQNWRKVTKTQKGNLNRVHLFALGRLPTMTLLTEQTISGMVWPEQGIRFK